MIETWKEVTRALPPTPKGNTRQRRSRRFREARREMARIAGKFNMTIALHRECWCWLPVEGV